LARVDVEGDAAQGLHLAHLGLERDAQVAHRHERDAGVRHGGGGAGARRGRRRLDDDRLLLRARRRGAGSLLVVAGSHRRALAFGSSASRTSSPKMMKASTVTVSATDGYSRVSGAVRMVDCACEMSLPHDIVLEPRPMPRKLSVASATIAAPSEMVSDTMTGVMELGSTWPTSVDKRERPRAREAVTKSRFFTCRISARRRRASTAQENPPMAKEIVSGFRCSGWITLMTTTAARK